MIRRENRKVMSDEGKRERIFKGICLSVFELYLSLFFKIERIIGKDYRM